MFCINCDIVIKPYKVKRVKKYGKKKTVLTRWFKCKVYKLKWHSEF